MPGEEMGCKGLITISYSIPFFFCGLLNEINYYILYYYIYVEEHYDWRLLGAG